MHSPDFDRRGFLKLGLGAALGSLFLQGRAQAEPDRGKNLVLFWLDGGPSQLETFDPKPGHANGGPTGAIDSGQRGLQLAEHLPLLAARGRKLAVVRSLRSREGEHDRANVLLHTGYPRSATVDYPTLGTILSSELPPRRADVPAFVTLGPDRVGPGYLGTAHAAFAAGGDSSILTRRVGSSRLDRRLQLLQGVEGSFAGAVGGPKAAPRAAAYRQAARILSGPLREALDLSRAEAQAKRAYGEDPLCRRAHKAARLIGAGVRCVEIVSEEWDDHERIFERIGDRVRRLDRAVATLMDDLEQLELLDRTLVLVMGEFGRTAVINAEGGRDHQPQAFSALLAGGGVRPGVVGASTPDGAAVAERPVGVPDLFATVLTLCGIDPETEKHSRDRPVKLADSGEPVQELIG